MPPETSAPVLQANEVSVRFGGVQALQDVSIRVPAGSISGLIGPNGAGKTTLFDVLTGLRRPDGGQVTLGGRDVTRLGTHKRARLGLARTFQRLELFWSLTVEDNVRVGAEARVQWWRVFHSLKENRDAIAKKGPAPDSEGSTHIADREVKPLLEKVGLSEVSSMQVGALPTGQARLVELARALATRPSVLLLDEPSSGLDESESAVLGSLLVDLAHAGMAVLLVEHDMDLLMKICDSVTVLDTGTVIASGTPDEVKHNNAVRTAYLGDAEPEK